MPVFIRREKKGNAGEEERSQIHAIRIQRGWQDLNELVTFRKLIPVLMDHYI